VLIVGGCGLVAGVLAVATWGDGDPGPWIWISLVCAPLAASVGGVAWMVGRLRRTAARAATAISALVTLFWALVIAFLITGDV
jgi:hypothetical protein